MVCQLRGIGRAQRDLEEFLKIKSQSLMMKTWRLFCQHPASVGESYLQHWRAACTFGLCMLVGGIACLVHAVFPFLYVRTASNRVAALHARMITHRANIACPRDSAEREA